MSRKLEPSLDGRQVKQHSAYSFYMYVDRAKLSAKLSGIVVRTDWSV